MNDNEFTPTNPEPDDGEDRDRQPVQDEGADDARREASERSDADTGRSDQEAPAGMTGGDAPTEDYGQPVPPHQPPQQQAPYPGPAAPAPQQAWAGPAPHPGAYPYGQPAHGGQPSNGGGFPAPGAAPGTAPQGAPQAPPPGTEDPQNVPAPGARPERKTKKKAGASMLVVGLVIGAVVGGASGAGAFAIIDNVQQGTPVSNSSPNSSVTINNTDDVTKTTAIAAKAAPSVVTIQVRGEETAGSGSGVILSKDGYVLTNNHVVTLDGESSHPQIRVTDDAGNLYHAKVVGTDPIYDLAVIKLEDASGLTPMAFGDSSKVNVGDASVAIGAPLGLAGTVTDGIVSAMNRSITVESSAVPGEKSDDDQSENPFEFELPGKGKRSDQNGLISLAVIQTDAAINPGNSGGALVNDEGKLIGVNVAIASAGQSGSESGSGSIGVGFAIPANVAKRIADELIEDGEATHGLLGAAVVNASEDPDAPVAGAKIADITRGGAAEKAGLHKGDIITKINDITISDKNDITAQVRAVGSGEKVSLTYVRDGEKYTTDATLDALKQ